MVYPDNHVESDEGGFCQTCFDSNNGAAPWPCFFSPEFKPLTLEEIMKGHSRGGCLDS